MAPVRPRNTKQPGPGSTLADSETQLAAGNLDEAIILATRALDATGPGGDFELRALNLLGMLHVETGDIEEARVFFERAVKLDEDGLVDEKVGGGPEKFLFLAQLSDEGGQDSVLWFERGAAALRRQVQILSGVAGRTSEQQADLDEKQHKLGGVLCAVAEVYMTDLSWEDDAEQRCEALITEAMMIAPNSAETWQTVGNVRISQERVQEAKTALARSLELWRDLPPEHPAIPEFPTRIALARLLLETEMEEEALAVLERLVTDDDQSVEAWYLGGWCLYIDGEKQREAQPQEQNGAAQDEWKSTWSTARKWLARCLKLYAMLEYEDERLGEHAVELFENINKELGEMPEGEEEDWDDSGDENHEDEDEEMQD
ncbi:tetratricopeptide repeat domain-containing protein [Hirsutella rhossiliensis]|uniref:Tetratricopeptide repeat domain-containing protein n=1 Tax=Hirsutella rhossiliensis TaxID=111463 RepID=A0A9P8SDM3_9HYPO|nr:tetratricopeptide repeat domain-containing protein [Hirsutella rhossiliensis]KAH0957500.1 tetratricopeptide repeat domain-containing protein [Hirsutella rhossiliensis]